MKVLSLFPNYSKSWLNCLVIVTIQILLASGVRGQEAASVPQKTPPQPSKNGKADPKQWEKEFWKTRGSGKKSISTEAYDQALEQFRHLPKANLAPSTNQSSLKSSSVAMPLFGAPVTGVQGTVWAPIGPSPLLSDGGATPTKLNGRVNSIALNPNNPNVIYQGSAGGGVWRSIDGGKTWTPLSDQQASLGTGKPTALTLDPNNPNVIYVGTSQESELGVNQIQNLSKGILKSSDGGASWIVLGSGFPAGNSGNATNFYGDDVNSIIVEPANSSTLYLGAKSGLYRSTDGGRNWTRGTGPGTSGNVRSLSLDPTSPTGNRILYAGISGLGVVQSQDGGLTWTSILTTATPAVSAAMPPPCSLVSVFAALAPPAAVPNPAGIQVIYAALDVVTNGAPGPLSPVPIFKSTDQGTTWTQVTATGLSGGSVQTYQGYILTMGVDPASPGDGVNDIIYWAALGQFKSTDSGANFSSINAGHADNHTAWTFAKQPSGPSLVLIGDDGGIFESTDGGATFGGVNGAPNSLNEGGLQTTLFYHSSVKNDATASVSLGALQDNGDIQSTAVPVWTERVGGDGIDVAFDAINTSEAYGIANTYFGKTFNSGVDNFSTAVGGGIPATEFQTFANRVNVDPENAELVYFSGASNGLYQSFDGGTTFRNIGNLGGPTEVDVAPGNSNFVAVAVGGTVFFSSNALSATVGPPSGVTFRNLTGLPGASVTQVAFDPNDPGVLYATVSGIGNGHVFRRTIASGGWTDISPPVDIPYNALALDGVSVPTTIYVGNDLGVLRSVDGGASWATVDDLHFPNVPVMELKVNSKAGVLQAATFGRGVFQLSNPSGPVIAVNAQNGLKFGLGCAGTPEQLTLQVFNVGNSNLVINSVTRLIGSSDFSVLPNPAPPLIISPAAEVDFTVQYNPTAPGPQQATIRIASNDPSAPYYDLTATGTGTNAIIDTVIANGGNFGDVCLGSFKDLTLTINNSGGCDLVISNITSNSSQFLVASVLNFPLVIHAGGSLQVPIRFQPTSLGSKSGMISIKSNDPTKPAWVVPVSGNVPPGSLRISGSTDFGDVCAGTIAEKTISICNVGECNLTVTNVGFNPPCSDFTLINNPFPAVVGPGACLNVVIRLTPTTCGSQNCNLQIVSDDTNTPVTNLTVTASTPCPQIDVPSDLGFGPEVIQSAGSCTTSLPFPISNKGECNLTITSITITGASAGDFAMSGLPSFPIILQPGHIVGEGDFNVVFAPTAIARSRLANINVTYVSDPVTGATTTVSRALCGEGVLTGARVLVMQGGVPVPFVEKIQLQRINANRNKNQLDTQDVAQNLSLVTVTPTSPCGPFQYHREYGTVSNPIQLLPGSYQVTAAATINGKRKSKTVGFNVNTCDFNPTVIINF